MRQRSKEINIFSISALDLFASALGAFILLAVVFLPFFPNTGDSQERIDVIQAENEALQAEIDEMETEIGALEAQVAELESREQLLPPVDVMILLDTTSSMGGAVSGLRADAQTLSEILQDISASAAMGVISFKDRCEANAVTSVGLAELTPAHIRSIQGFASGLQARSRSCNQDDEEAINLALEAALRQPWRSEAEVQVIVIVSDNAAYPGEQRNVLGMASRFASARSGRRVSTVYVQTRNNPAAAAYLQSLANAGRGDFVPAGGSFIGNVLKAILS